MAYALAGYLLTYAAAWILIGLTGHLREDPQSAFWPRESLSRWESFLSYLYDGVRLFALIGIPSMLLILVFVICGNRSGVDRRGTLITLLLLPTWLLFFAGSRGMLFFQLTAQVVYGLAVMPAAPARPGSGTGPPRERTTVTTHAGSSGRAAGSGDGEAGKGPEQPRCCS